jgi:phage terminase large subunit-like protein
MSSAAGRLAGSSEEERARRLSLAERLALAGPDFRAAYFHGWSEAKHEAFRASWGIWSRPSQQAPDGDWRVWLLMAGRGFGKTRAGAEWVLDLAGEAAAAGKPPPRIALVGSTADEARAVMVEGSSGILACADERERPEWEPSLGRLTFPSGARAAVFSGANPEALRGPEHDFAWCDELAKWAHVDSTWDNLMFGLRLGDLPRALVTTTPRPVPLLKRLQGRGDVKLTRGRTQENGALADSFVDYVAGLYGGTRLGRQELDGELIDDVEGSLWPRDLIERCRAPAPVPEMRRIVVGVDPPAGVGADACGIAVCGLGGDGMGYVLADSSVAGARPEGWARAAVAAAQAWGADRVVAEGNQGGAMVESLLRSVEAHLPVRIVHASHGKSARAEPVAGLFEAGRAKFAGAFPDLEDELAGLTVGGSYEGPGRSPDRADAMVWAMTELMLGKARAEPRVRRL